MAQNLGVRQYLKDSGYKDDEIGYDQGTTPGAQRVTLQGKTFLYRAPGADGRVTGDQNEFSQALQSYRQNNLASKAESTLGQVEQATNTPAFEYKPAAAFSYNKDTDPEYAAALATAKQNISTQQSNTNAQLRATGQGKSSYSETVANQIGNKEMANISNTVLPNLINQAYAKYNDNANRDFQTQQANYGTTQDRIRNLASLQATQSGAYQRGFDNDIATSQQSFNNNLATSQNELQNKQANFNAAATVGQQMGRIIAPKSDWANLYNQTNAPLDYTAQRDQVGDKRYDAEMIQQASQFAASQGLQWANLSERQKENILQQQNREADILRENDPQSLDNQYKQAQINNLNRPDDPSTKGKLTLSDYKNSLDQTAYDMVPSDPNDKYSDKTKVLNPTRTRKNIINLKLPDDQTDELLLSYGIPPN